MFEGANIKPIGQSLLDFSLILLCELYLLITNTSGDLVGGVTIEISAIGIAHDVPALQECKSDFILNIFLLLHYD